MSRLENRIPPPLVAAAFALVMWAFARWLPGASARFPGQVWAAALLLAAAMGVIATAIGQFVRARTTVDPLHPDAASTLVDGGVFRLTRNPMYLGMALVLAAWALWLGNAVTAVLVAGFVAWITRFQIVPEERALRGRFGDSFDAYARRVRRWI
jgi:protein-S-isoprenylcysteine O-methyltransferase Ste14